MSLLENPVNNSDVSVCPHCISSKLLFVDHQYGSCLNCHAHLSASSMSHYFDDGTHCDKVDTDDECNTIHGNVYYDEALDKWVEYKDEEDEE